LPARAGSGSVGTVSVGGACVEQWSGRSGALGALWGTEMGLHAMQEPFYDMGPSIPQVAWHVV
jgi:hypothetical protein